jgi:TonB family protein
LGEEFDRTAVDTVKLWKFVPATRYGKPIAVQIAIKVDFHR